MKRPQLRLGRLKRLRSDSNPDGRMTLVEHLSELRSRLFRALLALVVGTVVAFIFYPWIFDLLKAPYCGLPEAYRLSTENCVLTVTRPLDAFAIRLKVSLTAGTILSAPLWLYQLWAFITPGLHRQERRWALLFVGVSVGLFLTGASFAYLTLDKGLAFLLSFADDLIPVMNIFEYLSFVQAMLLIFGIAFEFPLLVVLLNFAGVVSYQQLRSWRRMEIFLVFVVSAFITPSGDPFTLAAMAGPLALLYEVALLVARSHDKRVAKREAEDASGGLEVDEASMIDTRPSELPLFDEAQQDTHPQDATRERIG